jgi:plastocyanin
MLTRRTLLRSGGGLVASAVLSGRVRADAPAQVVEIHMRSDPLGGVVGFDPVGVLLKAGATVRWICDANVHTATAYSPTNESHSLRIPKGAPPWASDFLLPGQTFEVTLTLEGVYDYFCAPHEEAGMVGRLIVDKATGPGALPFDYFEATGERWKPVPPAAQKGFPSIDEVLRRKVVPSPLKFSR